MEEKKEIINVLEKQYKMYFAFGNICFAIYINLNILRLYEKFGLNIIFSFLSIGKFKYFNKAFYSFAYFNYKKSAHTKGIFSFISFNLNISFLLSWNVCLFLISLFSFLENYEILFSLQKIKIFAYFCHIILCSSLIIFLSYFKDIFYSALILLFQIGIVIRSKNFSLIETKLNLFLCLFNSLCVAYILIIDNKNLQSNIISRDEIDTMFKNKQIINNAYSN